jgi:hypothetical protein
MVYAYAAIDFPKKIKDIGAFVDQYQGPKVVMQTVEPTVEPKNEEIKETEVIEEEPRERQKSNWAYRWRQ